MTTTTLTTTTTTTTSPTHPPSQVRLRTSTLPLSPTSPATMSPQHHRQLTAALLSNSSMPTIEDALAHELAASGWSTDLRTYVRMLLRSGECGSYAEVMERVLAAVQSGGVSAEGKEGKEADPEPVVVGKEKKKKKGAAAAAAGGGEVNGAPAGGQDPIRDMERQLRVPEKVVLEGVKVVRRELERCCDIVVDDV